MRRRISDALDRECGRLYLWWIPLLMFGVWGLQEYFSYLDFMYHSGFSG